MADTQVREARRQRILRRGADRLAFITGERKSLPSVLEEESAKETGETLPMRVDRQEGQVENEAVSTSDQGKKLLDRLPAGSGLQQQDQQIHRVENGGGVPRSVSLSLSSSDQQQQNSSRIFAWEGLSASIDHSRLARAILAAALAVIVAIQSLAAECRGKDLPFASSIQPTIVLFTTGVALVVTLTLVRHTNATKRNPENDDLIWSKALAIALTAKKIATAFSEDFGIYVVTLVCAIACIHPWLCI